ncbi:hypothetical protein Pmar_PMAR002646, partial [Perkinsus marinus ATCC 50983]
SGGQLSPVTLPGSCEIVSAVPENVPENVPVTLLRAGTRKSSVPDVGTLSI